VCCEDRAASWLAEIELCPGSAAMNGVSSSDADGQMSAGGNHHCHSGDHHDLNRHHEVNRQMESYSRTFFAFFTSSTANANSTMLPASPTT
jgi:hypothetical protein